MKKIISIFIIFIFYNVKAQKNYETFMINNLYGIVETKTLNEFVIPKYNVKVEFNNNFISFKDTENDSLILFSKKTGDRIANKVKLVNYSATVNLGGKRYLNSLENGKSVILDSLLQKRFFLPKQYNYFYQIESSHYFYAEIDDEDTFDIFKKTNTEMKILHSIKAIKFDKEFLVKSNGEKEEVFVFYGLEKTYLFNDNLELIKTINKLASHKHDLDDIINPTHEAVYYTDNGPEYKKPSVDPKSYQKISSDTIKNHYISEKGNLKISVFNKFTLDYYYKQDYLLYFNKPYFRVGNYSSNQEERKVYTFLIDIKSSKALIPLKYQVEMGLNINIKKAVK